MTTNDGEATKPLSTSDLAAANRESAEPSTPADGAGDPHTPLLRREFSEPLMSRWRDIQGQFVDSPRESVEQADALVAEVIQELTKSFADERAQLESQWEGGEDVATEDLRLALQRYRSFFQRLLAA